MAQSSTEKLVATLEAFIAAKVTDMRSDHIEDSVALGHRRDELIALLENEDDDDEGDDDIG